MKYLAKATLLIAYWSPSVWREWIEILDDWIKKAETNVSFRMEGVD